MWVRHEKLILRHPREKPMGAQKDNAAVNFETINQLKPDNSKIWRAAESRWTGFDTPMILTYTHFCSAGSLVEVRKSVLELDVVSVL